MKILQLNIEGFRSLKSVEWKPGDLNIVIGANASGKSNLLKALEFLSATARGELADTVQRMGGMQSILWDGRADNFWFDVVESGAELQAKNPAYAAYHLDVRRTQGPFMTPIVESERLSRGVLALGEDGPLFAATDHVIGRRGASFKVMPEPSDRALRHEDRSTDKPTESILGTSKWPGGSLPFFFSQDLSLWEVYNRFSSHSGSDVRQSPIARYEKVLDKGGQNLISVLHTLYTENSTFESAICDAMTAAFGSEFVKLIFGPASDQRVQMGIEWKSLKQKQSTASISDGTLHFLFIITALANPEPAPLIAIDEPETGLHPRMFAIIAEYAAAAARKTQIVFTTHSAEFLNAMSRFEPTTTITRWEDGETKLDVVDKETLGYWLKKQYLGEMFSSGLLEGIV